VRHKVTKSKNDNQNELSTDEINEVLLKQFPSSLKKIAISGGEPLIRQDISIILKSIIKKNIQCTVQSNLTINFDNLLAEEGILENIYLQTSIDGDQEEHDSIRGVGSFLKTMKNVELAMNYYNKNSIDSRLHINTVITKKNMFSLVSLVRKLIEIGITSISFQLLTQNYIDESNCLNEFELSELHNISMKIKEIAEQNKVKVKFYPIDISFENKSNLKIWYNTLDYLPWKGCNYISNKLGISPFGDVFSCIENKPLGNIRENSITDIWNGDNYKTFRKEIEDLAPLKECVRCVNYNI
jgi:radical SAM protein with 4Fe4S-binding SPASM domain